ncbi:MAG: hypothetical protein A2X18_00635 [Bacteroidetes bacterium GWF2_40_14]|nr:MAG: hypothetical protein A2X18_00635 [Bacteroidetes bacterium GWF2_40_14]
MFGHNLNEALIKAKAENKLIFIDFYTSWCGPCKVLTNNVFPLERVGSFFNSNFINCKIQCDDNGIGVEMGKKYQVGAYPTLMFLNKYGEFIHSAAGALSPEELINLGKVALDPRKNLYSIIKKWETGKRDSESALIYFKTLKEAYRSEKASEDFNLYFNNLSFEEKTNSKTFKLIKLINPGPTTPVFNFIEDNFKSICINNDSIAVKRYLINSYNQYLYSFISTDKKDEYLAALAKFKSKKFLFEDEVVKYIYILETLLDKPFDIKEYQKRGTEFLEQYGKNNDGYVTYLTSLLGNCTGRYDEGAEGIKWMKELISRNNDPGYLSTYFYILWRNHRWDDAVSVGKIIRENNIKSNKDNTTIDKQIADCILYKEKYAQRDAEAKTKLAGQSDSIIFEHQNFDRILAKSKETGKHIFMDAYTTWCGPCKYMAKNVFTVDKVAIYFNKNFINTKVDMEKGEGITLREKYKIVAYPTFLLIDAEGNEIHRIVGSFDPDEFIAKIEEGLGNKSVSRMNLIYKQNQYDNDFIISYIKKLTEVYKNEEASEVADKYLNKLSFSEKADPKNWFIFENRRLTNYGSDRYQFIIKNRKALHESIGKERVEKLISRFLLSPLLPYLQGLTEYDAKRIDQIEKEVKDIKPINSKDILLLIKLTRARGEKNFEKFINLVDSNGDKISSSTLVIVVRVMGFIAEEGGSKEQCTKASEVLSKFYAQSEGDSNKEYHLRVVNYLKKGPYTYKKKTEKV